MLRLPVFDMPRRIIVGCTCISKWMESSHPTESSAREEGDIADPSAGRRSLLKNPSAAGTAKKAERFPHQAGPATAPGRRGKAQRGAIDREARCAAVEQGLGGLKGQ